MKLWDDIKKWAKPYSDEEEDEYYDDDYEEEEAPADGGDDLFQDDEPAPSPAPSRRSSRRSSEPVSSYSAEQPRSTSRVVNLSNAGTQLQVVLVRPESFDCVSDLCMKLRDRQALLLNLEQTDKSTARRVVDFLSGSAYALDGKIKKVASAAYLITPYNVEIVGDLADKLENSGIYN